MSDAADWCGGCGICRACRDFERDVREGKVEGTPEYRLKRDAELAPERRIRAAENEACAEICDRHADACRTLNLKEAAEHYEEAAKAIRKRMKKER